MRDEPPLICHPDADLAPALDSGYTDAIASYRETLPEHIRLLFDRFQFLDRVLKVVGVGSVGTMCRVGPFMAADNDPLFPQVKEARASVLEPHAGKSLHANHGQPVIAGQRIMQTASDMFPGWTRGKNGRDFYVRQLLDMQMSVAPTVPAAVNFIERASAMTRHACRSSGHVFFADDVQMHWKVLLDSHEQRCAL
jgi:hypothetical protein